MKTAVFVEKNPVTNTLRDVSIELAWKAHSLMEPYNGEVIGLFTGNSLPKDVNSLFKYGVDKIIHFQNNELEHLHSIAYKNIISEMIKSEKPDYVLFGATHTGRDIAPLVASTLGTGLTADCTGLYIDDYKDKGKKMFQMRPAFGGNILATIITPDHSPIMATVREGVMKLPDSGVDKPENFVDFQMEFDANWIVSEFISVKPKSEKINLSKYEVIVAGGAGVGSKEDFNHIINLAHALNGEVAASRAAVDFGFTDKSRQVGQTGSVVRPKLYIACGISGSIQHRAGMEESSKIIAINTDPEAPIFGIAHIGIVGDLKEVIPTMIKYLREE